MNMKVTQMLEHMETPNNVLRDELETANKRGVVVIVWDEDGSMRTAWSTMPIAVLMLAAKTLDIAASDAVAGAYEAPKMSAK